MCYWSVLVTGDQSEALNLLKCQRIGWCEWQGKSDMQGLRLEKKLSLGKNGHEFQVNVLHPFPNSKPQSSGPSMKVSTLIGTYNQTLPADWCRVQENPVC